MHLSYCILSNHKSFHNIILNMALRKTQMEIVKMLTGMDIAQNELDTVWERLQHAKDAYGNEERYVPLKTVTLKTPSSAFHDAVKNITWAEDPNAPEKFDQYGRKQISYIATSSIPDTPQMEQGEYNKYRRRATEQVETECVPGAKYLKVLQSYQKGMKFDTTLIQNRVRQQIGY